MKKYFLGACPALLIGLGLTASPCSHAAQSETQTAPDNTKANKGANGTVKHSADSGARTDSDLKLMKEIRQAVVSDDSLSVYAHNIKIMAKSGKVTLKGPVHTEAEKSAIEAYAQKFAGDGNVMNQITVKGESK